MDLKNRNAAHNTDPNVLAFTASIDVLKGILQRQQQRQSDRSSSTRDDDAAADETHGPSNTDWLPETWQAQLLSVETELKTEQAKRKAAEEAQGLLQTKVTRELEPSLATLRMQVNRLSHQKEQLTMDLEQARELHVRSMTQLETTVTQAMMDSNDTTTSLRQLKMDVEVLQGQKQDLAAAIDQLRHQQEDVLNSLQMALTEMTNARDDAQSLLLVEQQERAAERNASSAVVVLQQEAEGGRTTTQTTAARDHAFVVQTLIDHLHQVTDSAAITLQEYESLVSSYEDNRPEDNAGRRETLRRHKEDFVHSTHQAMEVIRTVYATADAVADTNYYETATMSAAEEVVAEMQDDCYESSEEAGPLAEGEDGAPTMYAETVDDGMGGEESPPDTDGGEELATVAATTLQDLCTVAAQMDAITAANEGGRIEKEQTGHTTSEAEYDEDDDSGAGTASTTGEGEHEEEATMAAAAGTDAQTISASDLDSLKRPLETDDDETTDNKMAKT
jgi:hypothetical protein